MELTVSLNWTWPGIEGEEWPRFRSSEASCWGNVRTTVMAGLISILFLAVQCSCHIGFGKWKLLHWISKMLIYRKFDGIQWSLCLFVSQLCFPRPRRGTEQSHELQGLKRSEDGAGLDIFLVIQILIYWQCFGDVCVPYHIPKLIDISSSKLVVS